jgi:hypothetical protein
MAGGGSGNRLIGAWNTAMIARFLIAINEP